MALPVIYQLMTMVILMVIGVILQKKKILSLDNSKGLSIVLTRVAVPCNMVSMAHAFNPSTWERYHATWSCSCKGNIPAKFSTGSL